MSFCEFGIENKTILTTEQSHEYLFLFGNLNYNKDALITLRAKIRQAQAQNQQIVSRMAKQQEESGTNAAARRFLDAIDQMRQPDAGED